MTKVRNGLSMSRARGVMFGFACGDALGAPVEFWSSEEINARFSNLTDLCAFMDGLCTDDTQMSLALAEGLLDGGPDGMEQQVGYRFIRWLFGSPRGVGWTCNTAIGVAAGLMKAPNNMPPDRAWGSAAEYVQALSGRPSEGNGALMRCAFIGLYARSIKEAEALAVRQARMTHLGPDNLAACAWYAGTIWAVSRAKHRRRAWNRRLRVLPPQFKPSYPVTNPGGTAVETLQAVVAVIGVSRSCLDAIERAIRLGGDTDTVAALVGGVAGAMGGGEDVVPRFWSDRLDLDVRHRISDVLMKLYLLG